MDPAIDAALWFGIFQSALGLAALLFAVFGFMYTLRGTHLANATEDKPDLAPIVGPLLWMCKTLSILTLLATAVAGAAVWLAPPSGTAAVLAGSLVVITAAAGGITVWLAFRIG